MFIVIEGLDGVGKSTISKALAVELGGVRLASPHDKFKNVRSGLEVAYKNNVYGRQLFYASTVLDISNEIRLRSKQQQCIIVDRYWLSTKVYHDWKCEGDGFDLTEVEDKLLVPDYTIYLQLSLEERRIRLRERDDITNEDEITLCEEADTALNKRYQSNMYSKISGRWLSVNASESVDIIVKNILQMMTEKI